MVEGFDDSSFSDDQNISEMVNAMVQQTFQNHPFDMYKAVAEQITKLGPLGLTLHKTPDFMNSIEMAVMQERYTSNESRHYMSQPEKEKLKASNFSARYLKIGSWEVEPKHEGDLVAKCYFAKRKLVWEVLDTQLKIKKKIEIQWSHISAIRATTSGENNQGILEIELNQPPTFFQEQDPQPRKHSIWSTITDFTQGQALKYRIHYLVFPPQKLEQTYEKILEADTRLHQLSKQPFPSAQSPYFGHLCYFRYNLDFSRNRLDIPEPPLPYCLPSMPMHPLQPYQQGLCLSTSPDSGMSSSNSNSNSYYRVDEMNQRLMGYWNQAGISNNLLNVPPMSDQIHGLQVQQHMDTNNQVMNQAYSSQDYDHFSTYNEAILPPDHHPGTQNGYANNVYISLMQKLMNQREGANVATNSSLGMDGIDHSNEEMFVANNHRVLDHMPENSMLNSSSSLVQESGMADFSNEYSTSAINANNSWT